jgi:hypothetical protein
VQITLFKEIFAHTTAVDMIEKVSCTLKESFEERSAQQDGIAEKIITTFKKNVVPLHQVRQLSAIKAKERADHDTKSRSNPLFFMPATKPNFSCLQNTFGGYQFPGRAHSNSLQQFPEESFGSKKTFKRS